MCKPMKYRDEDVDFVCDYQCSCPDVVLLFYLECVSKTNCFCFRKHYTTVSFVYDIYVRVAVFLFGTTVE